MASIHITITLDSGMRPADEQNDSSLIPATQIKGRLRASCEQLARMRGWRICQPPTQLCHTTPCVSCRLFGSPWLEGKLYFSDLTSAEPAYLDQRARTMRSRARGVMTRHEPQQRMIIPAGAQFKGVIHYDFSEIALLALVVAGLNNINSIGGGWGAGEGLCMVSTEARDRNNRPIPLDKLADALRDFQPT